MIKYPHRIISENINVNTPLIAHYCCLIWIFLKKKKKSAERAKLTNAVVVTKHADVGYGAN